MTKTFKTLFVGLVFLYLYAPIAVLVVNSFNASRFSTIWGGWSLKWYAELFGDVTPDTEKTLKVKLHYWRDGVVKHREFPQDSALDLTGK